MAIFTVHQAKTNLSKLIARAEAGEEIVIARGATPVAVLKAYNRAEMAERRRKSRGAWKGAFAEIPDSVWFDPLPEDELKLWEGHGPLITGEPDQETTPKSMRPKKRRSKP